MLKSVLTISRARLDRFFVGLHTRAGEKKRWVEIGHFIQGFDLMLRAVTETDGLLAETGDLGYLPEGSCEPAQNNVDALETYEHYMNGTRPVAMLVGDTLLLFDFETDMLSRETFDNRLAMSTSFRYNDFMKTETKFSRWIPRFERYKVKDLALNNGQLTYKNLRPKPRLLDGGQIGN